MKKLKIVAIIALTMTMQAAAMDVDYCCCLKLFFGYSYRQKKQEYIERLEKIERMDQQSINDRLDPLSYDQLEHIKKFIEDNGLKNRFPKLHPLVRDVAYFKDLENTTKTLSTPPLFVIRPMTRDNIRQGYHPGVLLMR